MIDAALLDKLKSYDTPTICNALEIVAPARRLTGFTVKPLVCPFPNLPPIVGYAKTATIRTAHAHELDAKKQREQRIAYYEYIADKPPPGIMVIQDLDGPDIGFGAFWGEVMSAVHKGLGLLGVVTDGCIRDIDQWAPDFQALAGSDHAEPRARASARLRQGGAGCRHAGALGRPGARRPARRRDDPRRRWPGRSRPPAICWPARRRSSWRWRGRPASTSPSCARRWPSRTRSTDDEPMGVRPLSLAEAGTTACGGSMAQDCERGLTPLSCRDGETAMKPNLLKKKIADGQRCVGGWVAIPDVFPARSMRPRAGTA